MLGNPAGVAMAVPQYGGLQTLATLLDSPDRSLTEPIVAKLRSAGVDSFRYILDHPLHNMKDIGNASGPNAIRIAARVWGRDDDRGGMIFTQQVRKRTSFCAVFYTLNASFYQDRLGTNIGKTQKRDACSYRILTQS
jgi:hypothetical protein